MNEGIPFLDLLLFGPALGREALHFTGDAASVAARVEFRDRCDAALAGANRRPGALGVEPARAHGTDSSDDYSAQIVHSMRLRLQFRREPLAVWWDRYHERASLSLAPRLDQPPGPSSGST